MTFPRHPLLRAVLALWGLLFLLGALFVGLLLGGAWLLWSLLRGGRPTLRFGAGLGTGLGAGRRGAPPPGTSRRPVDVIEGQATRVD